MPEANFKFLGFTLEKISYDRNKSFNSDNNSQIFPEINSNYAYSNEKKEQANIIMGLKYTPNNNLPFTLELIIRGFFDITQEVQAPVLDKVFFQNGSAIMYPYIRSIVTELTSKSNYTPIILPTINFYNLLSGELENYLLPPRDYVSYDEL